MSDDNATRGFTITPDKSPRACFDLCEQLGLIERMTHGDEEYVRFTQKGHNVMAALISIPEYWAIARPMNDVTW
jgi:hypothetical protein